MNIKLLYRRFVRIFFGYRYIIKRYLKPRAALSFDYTTKLFIRIIF